MRGSPTSSGASRKPCARARGRSSAVERPPETRRAAGSIPADHIRGSVAQRRQSTRLLIGEVQVRLLPAPLEGLPPARYPVSKTGGPRGLGGSTPSPSVPRSGVVERPDARLLIARRRFESCRRSFSSLRSGDKCPWRHGSLIPSRAWFDSRVSDSGCTPPWSSGDDAGLATGETRVRLPPGVLDRSACRGDGHPAGFGTGDRWFDSSRADCAVEERLSSRAS